MTQGSVEREVLFAYHAENKWDELLRGPISICADRVLAAGCDFLYTREWQRGPHLRIGLRGPAGNVEKAGRDVDSVLRQVLREEPSTRSLSFADVQDQARAAALRTDVELRTDWLEDNTLNWSDGPAEQDPESGVPALMTEFNYRASVPALRLLAGTGAPFPLGAACCDLMAATAQVFGRNGLAAAAVSFRSHAEAYLNLEADPSVRTRWEADAHRAAPALGRRLQCIAESPNAVQHVRAWLDAVRPVMDAAKKAQSQGQLKLLGASAGFSPELTARSSFHRKLSETPYWENMVVSDWFILYRFAVNLLYLQFSRLGLPPTARYRLCHLVATAVSAPDLTIPNKADIQ